MLDEAQVLLEWLISQMEEFKEDLVAFNPSKVKSLNMITYVRRTVSSKSKN